MWQWFLDIIWHYVRGTEAVFTDIWLSHVEFEGRIRIMVV